MSHPKELQPKELQDKDIDALVGPSSGTISGKSYDDRPTGSRVRRWQLWSLYREHMTELKYVQDVKRLLEPIFESMLSPTELRSLTFWLERLADGAELPDATTIETNDAWVRWQILGEEGGSGSLRLDDGVDALVRFVQSELQDFIAESHFGWGELRVPRDLP